MAVQQVLFGGVEPVLISPFDCVLQKDGPRWGSLGTWKLKVMGNGRTALMNPFISYPVCVKKKKSSPRLLLLESFLPYIYFSSSSFFRPSFNFTKWRPYWCCFFQNIIYDVSIITSCSWPVYFTCVVIFIQLLIERGGNRSVFDQTLQAKWNIF